MSTKSIEFEETKAEVLPLLRDDKLLIRSLTTKLKVLASRVDVWQLIVAIFGLFVAVVGLIIATKTISDKVGTVERGVQGLNTEVDSVKKSLLRDQFVITAPNNGTTVNLITVIRGKTPFPEMNHYLLITPLKTGDTFIQENAMNVDASGLFIGNGRFGTGEVGIGEKFLVRVLATNTTLSSGALTKLPLDAVFSQDLTVIRNN